MGNGSTFKEVSRKIISRYEIKLPTVNKQKQDIADLVRLDKRYDQNCEMLASLHSMLELIYINYFENDSIFYERKELFRVVEMITGGTPSTKNDKYWNNGIFEWYTPSDVTACNELLSLSAGKKISILGLSNSGAKLVPKGSVLMTSRATIGECVINQNEATTNQGILSLVPDNKNVSTLQLFFWIKRHKELIESISNGSTFKEVNKKDIGALEVPTNKESLSEFTKKTEPVMDYYLSILKENVIIDELKKRIMQVVFSK